MRNKIKFIEHKIQHIGCCHNDRTFSCHPERSRGIFLQTSGTHRSRPDVSTWRCSARHYRWPSEINRGAFTLIELLVVMAVIALLIAILLPTLQRVKRQAKAVACQSKLRQWGVALAAYQSDHEGALPPDPNNCDIPFWNLRRYISDSYDLYLCPMAAKFKHWDEPWRGADTYSAWHAWLPADLQGGLSGSYGRNGYTVPTNLIVISSGARVPHWHVYWRTKRPNRIPVFLDSRVLRAHPGPYASPPEYEDGPPVYPRGPEISHGGMWGFVINRHDGGINSLFMDYSVRKVGLKELWTLKWHPTFNTAGPWTRAGGVQPESWPQWMRHFKDY